MKQRMDDALEALIEAALDFVEANEQHIRDSAWPESEAVLRALQRLRAARSLADRRPK